MDETTNTMIGACVRSLIIAFGGSAMFSTDQITAIAGAAAVLIGVAWSLIQKKNAAEKLQAAKEPRQ